ncbi:MAG: hypothetical protein M1826_006174 [Phylliscum demangeonii]|nr:MAG: hypothetical protein M1826_006174 [Phylliscum demangeonii]
MPIGQTLVSSVLALIILAASTTTASPLKTPACPKMRVHYALANRAWLFEQAPIVTYITLPSTTIQSHMRLVPGSIPAPPAAAAPRSLMTANEHDMPSPDGAQDPPPLTLRERPVLMAASPQSVLRVMRQVLVRPAELQEASTMFCNGLYECHAKGMQEPDALHNWKACQRAMIQATSRATAVAHASQGADVPLQQAAAIARHIQDLYDGYLH